jgi:hypothetical protein
MVAYAFRVRWENEYGQVYDGKNSLSKPEAMQWAIEEDKKYPELRVRIFNALTGTEEYPKPKN